MTRLLISNISEEVDFERVIRHLHRMLPDLNIQQVPEE